MKAYYLDKFIFFLIALLIAFTVFLQIATDQSTDRLKNEEIIKTEQYAANIAKLIQLRVDNGLEETLTRNPALRKHLNEFLQVFLSKEYRYIFILEKDLKDNYRFLLDTSKEKSKKYKTIFFPKSERFDHVYTSQKMQIIEQYGGADEVWLSLVYPMLKEGKTEALLVMDLSVDYGEHLNDFSIPLMSVVSMMEVLLIVSILLLVFLLYRYYRLRKLLLYDTLTSAYTKVFLGEFFNRHEVNDYNAILIDMDEFVQVNDQYGYKSGDLIIKEFTATMIHVLPTYCKIIRTGGTEFLVIVPKKHIDFNVLVKKLFKTLQEKKYLLENEVFHQTVSMSALIIPKGKISIYDVQRILDEKLLEIKSKGKNDLLILDLDYFNQMKYANIDYIKEALEEERLLCLYQPIFDTQTKKIVKYEALVRLIDKENKEQLVSPAQFMNAIKGTSQYIKMSKLIFKAVFHVMKKYPQIEISVNIDLDDLYNADMMSLISKNLYEHQKMASRLTFEILEENEISDYDQVALIFQQLKRYGSKIAIDDFGSGYANYTYLIKLDVDFLKIDGTLVQELHDNPERAKVLLASIKKLANDYNCEVVAEFVSSEDIYDFVKDLDIKYSQGYYLGEPKPIDAYLG